MGVLFRLAGAVSLLLCASLGGWQLSQRISMRRKCLQQICQLLSVLREEIRCRKTDLNSLYHRCCASEQYTALFSHECDSFHTLSPPTALNKEQADCFRECFSALGTRSASQECANLEYYFNLFTSYCEKAKQEETHTGALYAKLGIGAGIMAGIAVL